jgi:hypothetical protein
MILDNGGLDEVKGFGDLMNGICAQVNATRKLAFFSLLSSGEGRMRNFWFITQK